MTSQTFDTSRLSPTERHSYSRGIALVESRLCGHRKPTAQEIEAQTVLDGKRSILKKYGAAGYKRLFGTEPPAALTPPPRTLVRPSPKSYAKRGPNYTLHRLTVRGGLFG